MSLALFKRDHGVATHKHTGAGFRHPVTAFFTRITMKDGSVRSFTELAHEYSWEMLYAKRKCADGDDEKSACQTLALLNGILWPADEPKPRKARGRTSPTRP